QVGEQQSPPARLPSSQASPIVTMPLPQRVVVQLTSQPSPLIALPSSHSSPGFRTPSPQVISSAPQSTRGPDRRGAPARSVSPGAGMKLGSPALMAGDVGARCTSPIDGFASSGSTNSECVSAPTAATYAAKLVYSSPFQVNVPGAPSTVHQTL